MPVKIWAFDTLNWSREPLYGNPMPEEYIKLSALPADWTKDSSLETWFPITAEELQRLRLENERLKREIRHGDDNQGLYYREDA